MSVWLLKFFSWVWYLLNTYLHAHTHTHTHTHTQPFYGSVDFVRDNPGEPVPEETFTYSHSSWSSIVPICFLHLLRSMASSLFNPIHTYLFLFQCWRAEDFAGNWIV